MPDLPRTQTLSGRPRDRSLWQKTRKHLNFYRVHLLFFAITPLFFSAIFYASNGEFHISYVDALFNSVSAMTVCGLATVDLSSLTGWQQAILFIQMCLGSPVFISWFMVLVRRHYFAKKFEHIVAAELASRAVQKLESGNSPDSLGKSESAAPWPTRVATLFRRRTNLSTVNEVSEEELKQVEKKEREKEKEKHGDKKESAIRKLRTDMIRRMDDAPKLVDPSGWISEGQPAPQPQSVPMEMPTVQSPRQLVFADEDRGAPRSVERTRNLGLELSAGRPARMNSRRRRLSDPGVFSVAGSAPFPRSETMQVEARDSDSDPFRRSEAIHVETRNNGQNPFQRSETIHFEARNRRSALPRTTTIEFAPTIRGRRPPPLPLPRADDDDVISDSAERPGRGGSLSMAHPTLTRHSTRTGTTQRARATPNRTTTDRKHSEFGGFAMPHEIVGSIFRKLFPKLQRQLTRSITIPVSTTIASGYNGSASARNGDLGADPKLVPYISFDAVVGRNSAFHELTNEQMEELGGVEYRGLNALLWLVAGYHLITQLIAFIIIAPYISIPKWAKVFEEPKQHRNISSTWFSAFQIVSAYTNTGTSLVDQSMVPFQKAYPMILLLCILILAGNTAFPIFLRFTIWVIAKLVPRKSRLHETLKFLLDHPRRCFIYLFPSHQTWFLLTILVFLNCTDWFCFLVLDIGNPAIDSLPLGIRFIDGLLQAVAVRAAGFGTVTLSTLSPAVKVLYVMMMYISVYPIAMSVRSTNVYEEKSLGVYHDNEQEEYEEEDFAREVQGSRMMVWSQYLAMHARKQLAFDMWWLGLALFLVCIVERGAINDTDNEGWFNIFNIVFELVSAYGTVGLSLGIPTANYSLSGAFRPLSKFIVCLVMLRGRHRGLPVAIDRAVMLPTEFHQSEENFEDADDVNRNEPPRDRSSTPSSLNEKRRPSRDSARHNSGLNVHHRFRNESPVGGENDAPYRAEMSGAM